MFKRIFFEINILKSTKGGFSLIELLTVISIIGLLAAMGTVAYTNVRESARITRGMQFSSNVYQSNGSEAYGVYNFDEGAGTKINDGSGYGNDGALTNGPVWSADTPSGKGRSLSFDGVNDYVQLPASNKFTGNNLQTITVMAWVKSSTAEMRYAGSLKRSAGSPSSLLSLSINYGLDGGLSLGSLGFLTANSAGVHKWLTYNGGYNDGRWHHLAAVVNGPLRMLYVDGVKRNSDGEGIQSVSDNTDYAAIGAFDAGQLFFPGLVDDFFIFQQALSALEIKHYAQAARIGVISLNK